MIFILLLSLLQVDKAFSVENTTNVTRLSCLTVFQSMEIRENKVYVLGSTTLDALDYQLPHIYIKVDTGFYEIPNTYFDNGILDTVKFSLGGTIKLDSKGNLWVSGYQKLYKYDGNNWSYFSINDTFNHNRSYRDLVVDKFDNIWFLTRTKGISKVTAGISELVRFDGNKFDIVIQRNDFAGFATKSYNFRSSFTALSDGRIVAQIIPLPMDSEKYPTDVLIVDQDFSITFSQSKTLDYPQIENSSITKIQEVSDTSFYALFGFVIVGSINEETGNQMFGRWAEGIAYVTHDTNWLPLDFSYGIPNFNQKRAQSMKTMCKLPNGDLLAISVKEAFTVGQNHQFTKKNWREVLHNATIYGTSSNYSKSFPLYDSIMASMFEDKSIRWNAFINEVGIANETLYLLGEQILFEVPLINVTSTNDDRYAKKGITSDLLFVRNEITLNDIHNEEVTYDIYDLQGVKVLSGTTNSGTIKCAHLVNGYYTLVCKRINQQYLTKQLLKVQ